MLRNCSRMHNESDRSSSPWYLLAAVFDDDLSIKKKERRSPRKTPRKMKTDNISICVEVFTFQN